jgi:hypothetical protein
LDIGLSPGLRAPLLFLGLVSLAFGVAGGLARLTPSLHAPDAAIAMHGALMVSAFFGTLISLERAVALNRRWPYAGPLLAGLGGIVIVFGGIREGVALLVVAALANIFASVLVARRQVSLETLTLLAGATAWFVGNSALALGYVPDTWWVTFFSLTVAAERLELSRYLKRSRFSRYAFAAIACASMAVPLYPGAQGLTLVALSIWLFKYDLARITVRQEKLPRYSAVCLLAGYFWLAAAGVLMTRVGEVDAALHAFFVGFVFSMVFGHAPIILPAVLRMSFPYRPILYVPLTLLHLSLALRILGSVPIGAWGNAMAIALFIVVAAATVVADRKRARNASLR